MTDRKEPPFRVDDGKVTMQYEQIKIAPANIVSANLESITMARDLTVEDLRQIIRQEIAEDRDRREVDALYAARPGPVSEMMPDGTIKMTR